MTHRDMDQQIANDWGLVQLISAADADLSARQEESLERAARVLHRDRPLPTDLRRELEELRDLLPELVAND